MNGFSYGVSPAPVGVEDDAALLVGALARRAADADRVAEGLLRCLCAHVLRRNGCKQHTEAPRCRNDEAHFLVFFFFDIAE